MGAVIKKFQMASYFLRRAPLPQWFFSLSYWVMVLVKVRVSSELLNDLTCHWILLEGGTKTCLVPGRRNPAPWEHSRELRLGVIWLKEPHLAWLSQWSRLTAVGPSPASPLCMEFLFLLVGRRLGVGERIINIPNKSAGKPIHCAKEYTQKNGG